MTRPYLYQTVHLLDGRPRMLEAHLGLLADWAARIFGIDYRPDAERMRRRIAARADEEGCPAGQSCFVRLQLYADGEERLGPAVGSLYRGYALRSLLPEATVLRYEVPLFDAPTSAREAAAALARHRAQLAGAHVAVRCDGDGLLRTADDAPLFAVRGKTVCTPPAPPSVERGIALRAVASAGFDLREEPLPAALLPAFDELFYVDHRGVTALAHCDGNPYMALYAERIAAAMEAGFAGR